MEIIGLASGEADPAALRTRRPSLQSGSIDPEGVVATQADSAPPGSPLPPELGSPAPGPAVITRSAGSDVGAWHDSVDPELPDPAVADCESDVALLAAYGSDDHWSDEGMSTVEYAIGTVVAAAFAAVLYRIVTGDSVISGLTNLINSALNTAL